MARLHLVAPVINALEEEKGDYKEGAMQTYPQIGPGRRVYQGPKEVRGVQEILRDPDPRQSPLTSARGGQGLNLKRGQDMEAIGKEG